MFLATVGAGVMAVAILGMSKAWKSNKQKERIGYISN